VQGSRSDFDELIKLDPQDGRAYYQRGSWYRNIGNEAAAIADFEQALKLQPDLAQAKKALEQPIQ
jgi:tetratricopeptide (TPR) repeat protein